MELAQYVAVIDRLDSSKKIIGHCAIETQGLTFKNMTPEEFEECEGVHTYVVGKSEINAQGVSLITKSEFICIGKYESLFVIAHTSGNLYAILRQEVTVFDTYFKCNLILDDSVHIYPDSSGVRKLYEARHKVTKLFGKSSMCGEAVTILSKFTVNSNFFSFYMSTSSDDEKTLLDRRLTEYIRYVIAKDGMTGIANGAILKGLTGKAQIGYSDSNINNLVRIWARSEDGENQICNFDFNNIYTTESNDILIELTFDSYKEVHSTLCTFKEHQGDWVLFKTKEVPKIYSRMQLFDNYQTIKRLINNDASVDKYNEIKLQDHDLEWDEYIDFRVLAKKYNLYGYRAESQLVKSNIKIPIEERLRIGEHAFRVLGRYYWNGKGTDLEGTKVRYIKVSRYAVIKLTEYTEDSRRAGIKIEGLMGGKTQFRHYINSVPLGTNLRKEGVSLKDFMQFIDDFNIGMATNYNVWTRVSEGLVDELDSVLKYIPTLNECVCKNKVVLSGNLYNSYMDPLEEAEFAPIHCLINGKTYVTYAKYESNLVYSSTGVTGEVSQSGLMYTFIAQTQTYEKALELCNLLNNNEEIFSQQNNLNKYLNYEDIDEKITRNDLLVLDLYTKEKREKFRKETGINLSNYIVEN